MVENNLESSDEEMETSDSGELAYSLFDDFKSTDAFEVYNHMESKFGFKYDLLGTTTLHRIALLKYLQEKKDKKEDVLEAYNQLKHNKQLVLDNLTEFIKPPFSNDKLIWGFMESSDSEAEDKLLSNFVTDYPLKVDKNNKDDQKKRFLQE